MTHASRRERSQQRRGRVNEEWDRWPSIATARGYICASCRRIIAKDEFVSWSLRFSGWCDHCLVVLERIR
jgi:hypothetical protein